MCSQAQQQQIMDLLGLSKPPTKVEWACEPINWSAAVAAGTAKDSDALTMDKDRHFVCLSMMGQMPITAIVATAIVGTPLPRDAAITGASNTLPQLGNVLLNFKINGQPKFRDAIPADMLLGTAHQPKPLASPFVLRANDKIIGTATNNTNGTGVSASVDPYVVLEGFWVYE